MGDELGGSRRVRDAIAFEQLEEHLKVLAHVNRLRLLHMLKVPTTISQIRLVAAAAQSNLNPERAISRQAVRGHLEQLIGAGLVQVSKGVKTTIEYRLNHARLFAILEELRKLSTIDSVAALDPFTTSELPDAPPPAWEEGPKLVIVHGVREGKVFPLRRTALFGPRGWIIGRDPRTHVELEYDPFVSSENSEILPAPGGYRLLDLRSSRNGTRLNWRRLPIGAEAPLQSGDVIGVGRSLLVFRER